MLAALKGNKKQVELGGSKFVCRDLTILFITAPSLLMLLQLMPSVLAINTFAGTGE